MIKHCTWFRYTCTSCRNMHCEKLHITNKKGIHKIIIQYREYENNLNNTILVSIIIILAVQLKLTTVECSCNHCHTCKSYHCWEWMVLSMIPWFYYWYSTWCIYDITKLGDFTTCLINISPTFWVYVFPKQCQIHFSGYSKQCS